MSEISQAEDVNAGSSARATDPAGAAPGNPRGHGVKRRDFIIAPALLLFCSTSFKNAANSTEMAASGGNITDGTSAFIKAVPKQTSALLAHVLTPEQLQKAYAVISNPQAHGSIGPRFDYRPDLSRKPSTTVPLPLDGISGNGSAENPWRGAISAYLERFVSPKTPASFKVPEWGAINPAEVAHFMARLRYDPVAVKLPPGHYVEDAITIPPGIWLMADRTSHLHILPVEERRDAHAPYIRMNTRSGLLGLEISGANIREFTEKDKVTAIISAHCCDVHNNYIHHWPGSGIRPAGTRARESNWCRFTNNIIEYIGFSGARIGSKALFENNQFRYCGILRSTGGGGDDGVVAEYSDDAVIANNLGIGKKMPNGRHIISGQRPRRTRVLGNISIAEGKMRNNVGLSDGTHFNEYIGNILLGLGAGGDSQAGISNSGYAATITYNVSIGNTRAFRNRSSCDTTASNFRLSKIAHNYGEYTGSAIHRSSCYAEEDNEFLEMPKVIKADIEYEAFGFFVWNQYA